MNQWRSTPWSPLGATTQIIVAFPTDQMSCLLLSQ